MIHLIMKDIGVVGWQEIWSTQNKNLDLVLKCQKLEKQLRDSISCRQQFADWLHRLIKRKVTQHVLLWIILMKYGNPTLLKCNS